MSAATQHCAGLRRHLAAPLSPRGASGRPEDGGGGGSRWCHARAPLTGSRRRSTYLIREGPRRVRKGAGRNGDRHLARPIRSEDPRRRPIRARVAARRVGCRWVACVAYGERLGSSCLPRCFPRAPPRRPCSRREDTEEAGARCSAGSRPEPTNASRSGRQPPPQRRPLLAGCCRET